MIEKITKNFLPSTMLLKVIDKFEDKLRIINEMKKE